eukprot:CAMPEP_0114432878 /NCGR_PEP_ID=MMETSP0103-20121206/11392_1 /TAXON_ID=37642 ORGANISM="Paraphysomonas imperforata, Strain PA2" /NCGR_SAMPLE_ID=MMETSP0103 /ASSEMBLY_ACC=CAM_ASM_000201 /LENGTH=557 /DNA_ID=CAMNT_0001602587 /DNA_START=74 /DNA_END=1747 /DNA_ORIENTATION=+
MTWALAKVTKFLAICMSLRNSLKILKNVSTSHEEDLSDPQKRKLAEQCSGILMFWTIFGVFAVMEQYFEIFVRWFPLYYYGKTFFILFMAFPRLRFTEYVFYKVLVPSVEFIHANVWNLCHMPPGDILLLFMFHVVFVCFPMINHPDKPLRPLEKVMDTVDTLIVDSDSEAGEIDLDESLNESAEEVTVIAPLQEPVECADKVATKMSPQVIPGMPGVDIDIDVDDTDDGPASKENQQPFGGTEAKQYREDAKSEDCSLNFSFDDKHEEESKNDGFTLSLPALSGLDCDDYRPSSPVSRTGTASRETEGAAYESPSRVLRSFRKLLTGDPNARLSDTIFNLDLHSPPPNTQYRNRRKMSSVMPSPSRRTRQSEGVSGRQQPTARTVFSLGRSASLLEGRHEQASDSCYSPLHATGEPRSFINKENYSQAVGDSLDSLLGDSSDEKSKVTGRRRDHQQGADVTMRTVSGSRARGVDAKKGGREEENRAAAEEKRPSVRKALRSSAKTTSLSEQTYSEPHNGVRGPGASKLAEGKAESSSLYNLRRSGRRARVGIGEDK